MMHSRVVGRVAFVVLAVGLCAGCGSLEVTPVPAAEVDKPEHRGVRFYRPEPYLLVTWGADDAAKPGAGDKPKGSGTTLVATGEKAGAPTTDRLYTFKIVYLPNFQHAYAAEIHGGWGTIDSSLKLADGWQLTDVGAKIDSKVPETITAISGLVKELGGLIPKGTDTTGLVPGLYAFEYGPKGVITGIRLAAAFGSK